MTALVYSEAGDLSGELRPGLRVGTGGRFGSTSRVHRERPPGIRLSVQDATIHERRSALELPDRQRAPDQSFCGIRPSQSAMQVSPCPMKSPRLLRAKLNTFTTI
jgi:hypothetical protein